MASLRSTPLFGPSVRTLLRYYVPARASSSVASEKQWTPSTLSPKRQPLPLRPSHPTPTALSTERKPSALAEYVLYVRHVGHNTLLRPSWYHTLTLVFGQNDHRCSGRLGSARLLVAVDFRSRMLRRRDDALLHAAIRLRASRLGVPGQSATSRRHDCGGHRHQQDGPGSASLVGCFLLFSGNLRQLTQTKLRPDARPQMGHQHGELCKRRRVLPLQLLGRPGR